LAGCNKNPPCSFCDTEWVTFHKKSLEDIYENIKNLPCKIIVWTGGEPLIQLTEEIISFFNKLGYSQAIETNGTLPIPSGLAYVACSPKVSLKKLQENFKDFDVDEWRFVIGTIEGDGVYHPPCTNNLPKANDYFVSPLFDGKPNERLKMNQSNINSAVRFVKQNPGWKLSVQIHKILGLQ